MVASYRLDGYFVAADTIHCDLNARWTPAIGKIASQTPINVDI
jgi:hypothetical protein